MQNKTRPGVVELVHFTLSEGGKRQRPAYTDCLEKYGTAHTWVGFIDIDEFIMLKKHTCINDLLRDHLTQGSLSLNWVNFGTAKQKQYRPVPVTKRFQLRGKESLRHVKSFHRPADVVKVLSGHHCELKPNKTQHDTNNHAFHHYANPKGPTDIALIHHFFTKSEEEWVYKGCSRGRVSTRGKSPNCGRVPMVGTVHDSSTWDTLKRVDPKYEVYDQESPPPLEQLQLDAARQHRGSPRGVCRRGARI